MGIRPIDAGDTTVALALDKRVDEPTQPVSEQHVDLSPLDDSCHLAFTESRVQHGLPRPVRVHTIIGRARLGWCYPLENRLTFP